MNDRVTSNMRPTTTGAKMPPICPPVLTNPVKVPRDDAGARSSAAAQNGPKPPYKKKAAAESATIHERTSDTENAAKSEAAAPIYPVAVNPGRKRRSA